MKPLTSEEIERLEELEKKATAWPWLSKPTNNDPSGFATCSAIASTGSGNIIYAQPKSGISPPSDKEFITKSRNLMPRLLADWKRMKRALEVLKKFYETQYREGDKAYQGAIVASEALTGEGEQDKE